MKKFLLGAMQIGLILLFLVVAFVFSRAPSIEDFQSEMDESASSTTSSIRVSVVRPESNPENLLVDTTGTVEARNTVSLTSQVSGQVVWVSENLRDGSSFDRDEELLRIDPHEFELAVAQAEANLDSANANLELRLAESKAGKENWEIMNGSDEVPELVARTPQIAQSRASISTAEANLEIAKLQLSRTSVSLPFNGKILTADVGPGQFLTRGQPFGLAYDSNSLELRVNVSENEMLLLKPAKGRTATVLMGGRKFEAQVERTSSSVDSRNRTTTLYLTFQSSHELVPGHFVDVLIYGRETIESYRLPETVEQTQSSIWIVRNDELELQTLQVIAREGNEIIVSAFDYGDGIVVGALNNAEPGTNVVVNNPL
ncbi:MAG: efflux RND transporter periplasmic adaptor subunit [Gammaproteobacteria bacterium]|nr:efflux RND transporter periplasmic adaptor subunit [Gammaproteobacteria bacterium]